MCYPIRLRRETATGRNVQQLDLFTDRGMGYAAARLALLSFDLATAERALREHLQRYPRDDAANRDLNLVTLLVQRLTESPTGDELNELLRLRADLPEDLLPCWHRRIAEYAEDKYGAGATVGGSPVGLHWRSANEPTKALASLQATLEQSPDDARVRAYFADVLYSVGRVEAARGEYLRAFVDGPTEVVCASLADPAVLELVDRASEYDAVGAAVTWVAAIGTVEKVFPAPPIALPFLQPACETPEGVAPGLCFFWLLVRERAARTLDERVGLRRRMKELCPALLAAYLQRR